MAGLARKLAPAAALGGLALVIVGVADPALAGHSTATATSTDASTTTSDQAGAQAQAQTGTQAQTDTQAQADTQAATTTATCASGQSVAGPSVMTRWGPVQVAATIADGQLCEVHAVVWPTGDGRSIAINDYAIPVLDQAASQVGTQFDTVSGATYTSEGYRESLQQLLDSL
jgi:uncharacterized protein with FMN-binding domain